MNKKLLFVLSSTLLLTFSNSVFAVNDSKLNGFADIILTVTDEANDVVGGKNATEGKFTVDGEVDFSSKLSDNVSVRIDVDLSLAVNGGVNAPAATGAGVGTSGTIPGPADSAVIEQAFFAWSLPNNLTFLGGVFNNPVGWESEDAPDLYQTSHNQNWGILNGQTLLHGNNVAGVALAGAIGPINITGALLNDLQQVNEENSIAIIINATPITGLDVEVGFVTQDNNNPALTALNQRGAGDVTDINGTYTHGIYTVAVEILTADKVIDNSTMILGNVDLPMGFGVTARIEKVSFDLPGVPDTDVITLAGIFHAADNLDVLLEIKSTDDGTVGGDNDLVTAEFVSKF